MNNSSIWPSRSVEELCSSIVDCVNRTAPVVDGPTPFRMVRTTNVRDGFVDLTETRFVDEPTFVRWTRRQLPLPGDVILTREAPLGEVGILRGGAKAFLGQRLVSYRTDPALLDNRYLLYYLRSPAGRAQIQSFGMGATVAHMRVPDAKQLQIPIPPIADQMRIGSILGAYDDLIEVNRKRISALEGMARGLFEEWFVRFRFPGHEDFPVTDSPDGPLPKGWHFGPASELIAFDPRTRVSKEGDKPFIPMGYLDTSTSIISAFDWRTGNSGAKFRNGDTLFARITPCLENGKTGIVRDLATEDGVGFGSTEFIVMRGTRAGPAFAYCLARLDQFRRHAEAGMSGASGRQRAATDNVSAYQLAIPPMETETLSAFDWIAWPMLELSGELAKANQHLTSSRDLILPRLISGELSVATAMRELKAVA